MSGLPGQSSRVRRPGKLALVLLLFLGAVLGSTACRRSPTAEASVGRAPPPPTSRATGLVIPPPASTPAERTPLPSLPAPPRGVAASACPLLWLGRPIPLGFNQLIDPSYPFGSTQGGSREPHHGVDLVNPQGVPVIAAAAGTVIFAGDDDQSLLGPSVNFYGNTVVLQLDRQAEGRRIFLLQGHLRDIAVKVGQHVRLGETLGTVGATGVAIGAHLHFEVRVGTDEYTSVRNPELWLAPRNELGAALGAIAGRVVDASGHLWAGRTVTLRKESDSGGWQVIRFLTTYAFEPNTLGSDDELRENLAATDLEPGIYQVSAFSPKLQVATAVVLPGKLAWVNLGAGPDPLPACSQ